MTVLHFRDPVDADQYGSPVDAGKRFVGVQTEVINVGKEPFDDHLDQIADVIGPADKSAGD